MDVSKVPLNPPAAWFDHPGNIPTDRRITITDEGRVFGYVKLRGSCHTGMAGCLDAPDDSPSSFGFAHQGQTQTAEGKMLDTAIIAGGSARHASTSDPSVDILRAAAHYQEGVENQLMRVRYGSDQNGIWFSGALWPDANELDVAHILASPNSGDWRYVNYMRARDFAGAVLVNIPGYTMANAGDTRFAAGMMQAIAASAAPGSVVQFDGGGNIVTYTPAENPTEEAPMCQSCTCQNLPVTAAATPCTCDKQKPTCDCGGKNKDDGYGEKAKALVASVAADGETISFEEAVAMKFDEVFAQLTAHGASIGTIEARRLADELSV